jgi:ribonuclease BN (tRNA processing enzyme)
VAKRKGADALDGLGRQDGLFSLAWVERTTWSCQADLVWQKGMHINASGEAVTGVIELNRRLMLGGLGAATGGALGATNLLAQGAGGGAALRTKLVLLGTAGGPTPKPNRAAPSNAIVVDGQVYLIDAGNGTARQMAMARLSTDALRAIFLTHHHSDHNADIGNVILLGWAGALARPVDVIGPPPVSRMMRQFLALNDADIKTRIADEGRPPLAPLIRARDITRSGIVFEDDKVRVRAALVVHPPIRHAFAYRIDTPDRSVVISGDTAPNDALVELAQGADILVHEVMHLPSISALIATEPNATRLRQHLIDSHTSTAQVGQIATRAGVKTLVLSHFVPGGFPFLSDQVWHDEVRPHFGGELIVGRDLMEI